MLRNKNMAAALWTAAMFFKQVNLGAQALEF